MGRRIFLIIAVFSLFSWNSLLASEPVVIYAEGEYVMGSGETMEVAEAKALNKAKQRAAEQAGVVVKSYTKVKDFALEADFIEAMAHHTMKVEVLEKKKTILGDVEGIKFYVKIKATLSSEEIEANLKKMMQDQGLVAEYHRLKGDYERLNKETESLKRQLEAATGGDRQKIAQLISEEEKKYKAHLWLERALKTNKIDDFKKALELNPHLPQAYFGIAKSLLWAAEGLEQTNTAAKLKEALENVEKAIVFDEDYGEAYALRALILNRLKGHGDAEKGFGERQKDYHQRIRNDINRALALNVKNKGELYYLRGDLYLEELRRVEYEQEIKKAFDPQEIEGYLEQALAEIDRAGALCPDQDWYCLHQYYVHKGYA